MNLGITDQMQHLVRQTLRILEPTFRWRWTLAVVFSVVRVLLQPVIMVVFSSMFMGFYRFAAAGFPVPIRVFGVLFFGGILTFIFAGMIEKKGMIPAAVRYPNLLGSSLNRWFLSVLLLIPLFAAAWFWSGVVFDGPFSFAQLLRWFLSLVSILALALLITFADYRIQAYRSAMSSEILIPLLEKLGWKNTPDAFHVPQPVLEKMFPGSPFESVQIRPKTALLLTKEGFSLAISDLVLRERTVKKGEISTTELFNGLCFLVSGTTVTFAEGSSTGNLFDRNEGDFSTRSLGERHAVDSLTPKLNALLNKMEATAKSRVKLVSTSKTAGFFIENTSIIESGTFPPKAWEPEWLDRVFALLVPVLSVTEILQNQSFQHPSYE